MWQWLCNLFRRLQGCMRLHELFGFSDLSGNNCDVSDSYRTPFPEKVTFSREKVTFSPERMTFSDKRVTFRKLKLTFTLGAIRAREVKFLPIFRDIRKKALSLHQK